MRKWEFLSQLIQLGRHKRYCYHNTIMSFVDTITMLTDEHMCTLISDFKGSKSCFIFLLASGGAVVVGNSLNIVVTE